MKKIRINNISILHLLSFFAALYFYTPIITLYYQSRGLNFVQINSLWGIIVATKAIFEVPTGIIADKIGRKYSLIIAMFLQLLGEVVYIFANNYWFFAGVSVIAGIGFAFSSGCFEAMMYDTLKEQGKEKEMQKVTGLNSSFAQVAFMVSSLIGGLIASGLVLDKFVLLIAMTAFCVGVGFLISMFLHEPRGDYEHQEKSPKNIFVESISLLKSNKSLRKIVLLSVFATPFANYLSTFYQPYFVKSGVPIYLFGIAISVASLLGIFTTKYAYLMEKIFKAKRAIILSTILPAIFYVLMALIFNPIVALLLFIVASASMQIQGPIFSDYINRHIESKNRATSLSIISMFSGIYIWIMGLVIGAIADISLSYAFIFMGLIISLGVVIFRIEDRDVETKKDFATI